MLYSFNVTVESSDRKSKFRIKARNKEEAIQIVSAKEKCSPDDKVTARRTFPTKVEDYLRKF